MADALMDANMFSPEVVGQARAAETLQRGVNKVQAQQQVRSATGRGPAVRPDTNYHTTATTTTTTSTPTPPLDLKQMRTLAASYAQERAAEEQTLMQHLIKKIDHYHSVYKLERLHKTIKTLPEAQQEMENIVKQLNSKKGMGTINTLYYGLMNSVEWVTTYRWNPIGVDLKGLGTKLQEKEPELTPILLDIATKYGWNFEANPILQLIFVTGNIAKEVHQENKKGPKSMYSAAPDVSKFSDLGI